MLPQRHHGPNWFMAEDKTDVLHQQFGGEKLQSDLKFFLMISQLGRSTAIVEPLYYHTIFPNDLPTSLLDYIWVQPGSFLDLYLVPKFQI